jgi:hypothetical protein
MAFDIKIPAWDRHKNVEGLKQLPLLENTDINKQLKTCIN